MSIGLGSKVLLPFFAPFVTLLCRIKVQMLRLVLSVTTLRYTLPIVITFNQHLIMLHLSHKGSISVKVKCSLSRLATKFKGGLLNIILLHVPGKFQVISLTLSKMGQKTKVWHFNFCSVYDDIEVIDTSLAMEVIAKSEATERCK